MYVYIYMYISILDCLGKLYVMKMNLRYRIFFGGQYLCLPNFGSHLQLIITVNVLVLVSNHI